MARLRFLVADPARGVGWMLLIGRQPIHPMPAENPMHRGRGDRDAVKTLQVVGDLAWAKMVVLAQVQDLADDLPRRRLGRAVRLAGAVAQARITVIFVPFPPFVKCPSGQ